MNTHAVHESIRLLPPDSAAYGPKTRPLEAHQRWAKATYDPQWAWRIAVNYHQSEQPLPPSIRDQNIRRAYHYLEGARDDQMAMAHGIRTSLESGMTRSVLQGFLCTRDISLEGIASLLGLQLDVVKVYEGLFFNVRGRDSAFALNTIFPLTRLGAVREAELDYNEVELKMGNDPGSRVGLGSFGMKAPVLEHFRRITDTDTQYRLALLREEVMGQLAKTAAVAKET